MAYQDNYPLSLPTVTGIASITLRVRNSVGISRSPFTFKEQVFAHGGQMFEAEIQLPPMLRAAGEEWISFLIQLNGIRGTFLLGDPSGATPRGSASSVAGTPLVNGGGQTGSLLNIDGAPTSASGYLKAGDYIQLGASTSSTLHKVLSDVNTNSSGQAALDIFPAIRTAPPDGSAVTVSNARGVFRLASNETNWSINEAVRYGIGFAAVEAIA